MKVYIQRKVFPGRGRTQIKDESGNDLYYAESSFLSFKRRIVLFSSSGSEVAQLIQKYPLFKIVFHIAVGEEQYLFSLNDGSGSYAERFFRWLLIRPEKGVVLQGKPWTFHVEEENWRWRYAIRQGEESIASMASGWLSYEVYKALEEGLRQPVGIEQYYEKWADSIELEIPDRRNEILCIGIDLALDCMC